MFDSPSLAEVAAAPKNTTRRVPSLRELDEDLKHAIPSSADGLDMSLLTKTLVPPEMVSVACAHSTWCFSWPDFSSCCLLVVTRGVSRYTWFYIVYV